MGGRAFGGSRRRVDLDQRSPVDAGLIEEALHRGDREPVDDVVAVHDPVPAGPPAAHDLHAPGAVRRPHGAFDVLHGQSEVMAGTPAPAGGATNAFTERLRLMSRAVPVSSPPPLVRPAVWMSTARFWPEPCNSSRKAPSWVTVPSAVSWIGRAHTPGTDFSSAGMPTVRPLTSTPALVPDPCNWRRNAGTPVPGGSAATRASRVRVSSPI